MFGPEGRRVTHRTDYLQPWTRFIYCKQEVDRVIDLSVKDETERFISAEFKVFYIEVCESGVEQKV